MKRESFMDYSVLCITHPVFIVKNKVHMSSSYATLVSTAGLVYFVFIAIHCNYIVNSLEPRTKSSPK